MENKTAFDQICGDCAGVDIQDITERDVRDQAKYWNDTGETCSDEMVKAAIRGLKEYQEED